MTQLALALPQYKNGNNGHGRRERDLAGDLKHWLADLAAAETLRPEQLPLDHRAAIRSLLPRQGAQCDADNAARPASAYATHKNRTQHQAEKERQP